MRALLGIATVVDGLLAGASVDQSVEHLPSRRRIGVQAYRFEGDGRADLGELAPTTAI